MKGNRSACSVSMCPDGVIGIKGKGKFRNVAEAEKFSAEIREQILAAFWFQAGRGSIPATA